MLLVSGGRVVDCNDRATELLGRRRSALVGRAAFPGSPPLQPGGADSGRLAADILAALAPGEARSVRWRFRRGGSRPFDAELILSAELGGAVRVFLRDPGGPSEGQLRRRVAVEEAVARTSTLLSSGGEVDLTRVLSILGQAVQVNRCYIFRFRAEGRRMDNTQEWCSPGTSAQINRLQDLDAADSPWTLGTLRANRTVAVADLEALPPEAAFERQFLAAQGVKAYILVPMFRGGVLDGFLGFDDTEHPRDWTGEDVRLLRAAADLLEAYLERSHALRLLEEERAQLLSIFESIGYSIYVSDVETYEILYANAQAKHGAGGELVGKTCYRVFQRRDEPCPFCTNAIILRERGEAYRWEYHNPVNGRDYIIYNRLIRWPDGRDVRFELDVDVSEVTRARRELSLQTERLAVTLRSIGDGVITTDAQGRVTLLNRVAEELTGWEEREAAGQPVEQVFRLVDESTGQPLPDPVGEALRRREPVGLRSGGMLVARDGRRRVLADTSAPILGEGGTLLGAILVFQDVTERQKLERELARAEKLESLGVMAGGIAHDFNNILTGIIGNLSLAKEDVPAGASLSELIGEAERAALRARRLTVQLLTFSKGGSPVRRAPASASELLREAAVFSLRGSNVRCSFRLPPDLWTVSVDEGQIGQVVQNLVLNAAQAMPGGGTVTITAENEVVDREHPVPLRPGRYVRVSVTDHGVGISAERQEKVFDPFYTTKPGGSGLGLSSAYSIVRAHGGAIDLRSTPGEGTTVFFYLPAAEVQEWQEPQQPVPASGRFSGRVLVMDDEVVIRHLLGRMLARLGCQASESLDGEEALRLYREAAEQGRPFDLVILDLTVPGGMGGLETVARLREIDPRVTAVVSSGYSDDPVLSRHREHGFSGCIAKPFNLEVLARLLRDLLPGAGASGGGMQAPGADAAED